MTIANMLSQYNNENQYSILQCADKLFANRAGRYFGGQLSLYEIEMLTPPKRDH